MRKIVVDEKYYFSVIDSHLTVPIFKSLVKYLTSHPSCDVLKPPHVQILNLCPTSWMLIFTNYNHFKSFAENARTKRPVILSLICFPNRILAFSASKTNVE